MPIAARPHAPRSVLAAGLAMVVALGAAVPGPAHAGDPLRTPTRPPGLHSFMEGLAVVESGGRYAARNPTSGAYGRYQIMPSNWPAWARIYLGDRRAKPTPANQDAVAAGRLSDLRNDYGSWPSAAHWWLTGRNARRSAWSDFASSYVHRVMRGFRLRLASPEPGQRVEISDDRNPAILWDGRWVTARHDAYSGNHAHSSRDRDAQMKVRFTGRSIAIRGPVGPTRGRAAVYVDGVKVRVIDLGAGSYQPRRVLFQTRWRALGTHTLVLVVLGTRGRPLVAVDQIVVRR